MAYKRKHKKANKKNRVGGVGVRGWGWGWGGKVMLHFCAPLESLNIRAHLHSYCLSGGH